MTPLAAALVLALAPTAAPAEDPAWVGTWADPADPEFAYLLEEKRCGRIRDGKPEFFRMRVDGATLELERWGTVQEVGFAIDGDTLTVTENGAKRVLQRTEKTPAKLLVEPYEIAEPRELAPEEVEAFQAEFRWLHDEDQRVRPRGGTPTPASARAMTEVDERNTARLLTIMADVGWVDATRFGAETANTAFLIVQHTSDLRLMRTALPHIQADVEAKRLDGQPYALLFDRLQLNLGYVQRYGSQLCGLPTGGSALMPCEDLAKVDEYRAEMGMGPLKDYLALFGEDVPTLDEALGR